MSSLCRLSKSYCFAFFFLLHALLHLEIDCADYQFCVIWWKDTPATGLHSCLYSSKYHICGVQESRKTSACLTPVGTSGSFFRTRLCFLCLSVHCLSCLVSDGWIQSLSFLHIKELISAGLQAMLRGCCPRLVRCSFAPACSLQTVCYHNWTWGVSVFRFL